MTKISCIYKLENIKNHKVYIGETSNYTERKNYHMNAIRCKNHENPSIQKDLENYCIDDFEISIIETTVNDKSIRLNKETYWINYYGGIESEKVYNFKDLSSYNKDLIRHMSEGRKGIPAWNKGVPNIYCKGVHISLETKLKISQNHKDVSGSNNPNYKYNDEFKKQLLNDYLNIKNYSALDRKYGLPSGTSSKLIRFGKC